MCCGSVPIQNAVVGRRASEECISSAMSIDSAHFEACKRVFEEAELHRGRPFELHRRDSDEPGPQIVHLLWSTAALNTDQARLPLNLHSRRSSRRFLRRYICYRTQLNSIGIVSQYRSSLCFVFSDTRPPKTEEFPQVSSNSDRVASRRAALFSFGNAAFSALSSRAVAQHNAI